jgi:hypothetical protein
MHNRAKDIVIGRYKWGRSCSRGWVDSKGILVSIISTQVANSRECVGISGITRCICEYVSQKQGKDDYGCFVHFIINIIHLAQ